MGKAVFYIIGLLSALAALVWGCIYLIDYGGDARETKIRLEIETERAEALDRANKEIMKAQDRFSKNLKEIENDAKNDNDLGISRTLRNQLKRMRHDQD